MNHFEKIATPIGKVHKGDIIATPHQVRDPKPTAVLVTKDAFTYEDPFAGHERRTTANIRTTFWYSSPHNWEGSVQYHGRPHESITVLRSTSPEAEALSVVAGLSGDHGALLDLAETMVQWEHDAEAPW
ncbi:hypothetical protein NHL50_15735 [Acidimicrobiia bacterium EGI L10123]|uniref:hypothetical protein n=1 Tax=Salinilacustrithrix flava TaxID=2957203 RepID=UPI003D7C2D0C|nr:hypothetical protein [Acidimicrobiia bacterium EGI L10123]